MSLDMKLAKDANISEWFQWSPFLAACFSTILILELHEMAQSGIQRQGNCREKWPTGRLPCWDHSSGVDGFIPWCSFHHLSHPSWGWFSRGFLGINSQSSPQSSIFSQGATPFRWHLQIHQGLHVLFVRLEASLGLTERRWGRSWSDQWPEIFHDPRRFD